MTPTSGSHRRHSHSLRHQRESAPSAPLWNDPAGVSPIVFLLTCAVFICGLLFGGSGGSFGDTAVQLCALPLIVLAGVQWVQSPLRGPDRAALCILFGIVVLAFVQLAPLPLAWWTALPGRADLLRDMRSVGVTPAWTSLSLNPLNTERALQWTLPAIGMFLAVRWMSQQQRNALLWLLFIGGIAMTLIGLALHGGTPAAAPSVGDLLAKMNGLVASTPQAINKTPVYSDAFAGLFSNRNHFGTFLAMTIPLAVAVALSLWVSRRRSEPQTWVPWMGLLGLVIMTLLIAAFETRSRAALILGALAIFGSLALLRRYRLKKAVLLSIVACAMIGVMATVIVAGSATIARFDQGADIGMRWKVHDMTLEAARHFGPWGSGLGTFVQAYEVVSPEQDLGPYYINRAHGDYHELWLETGYPGLLLGTGFMGWFAWCIWLAWKDKTRASLIGQAATLSIALLLAHSYIDYPLRKTAILVVFGLCCALVLPAADAKPEPKGISKSS